MDPDAALARIRELAERIVNYTVDQPVPDKQELAELFLGLDQWICRGGFLPQDWMGENLNAE